MIKKTEVPVINVNKLASDPNEKYFLDNSSNAIRGESVRACRTTNNIAKTRNPIRRLIMSGDNQPRRCPFVIVNISEHRATAKYNEPIQSNLEAPNPSEEPGFI